MKVARKITISVATLLCFVFMIESCQIGMEKEIVSGSVDVCEENGSSITVRVPPPKAPYVGQTLSAAANLSGNGGVSYSWRRDWLTIRGQTGPKLLVEPAYFGSRISVIAYKPELDGAIKSEQTLAVELGGGDGNWPSNASLVLSGQRSVGEKLTATLYGVPNPEKAVYIWWKYDSKESADADDPNVPDYEPPPFGIREPVNAGGTTYILTDADVGKWIKVWAVIFPDYIGALVSNPIGPILEALTFGVRVIPNVKDMAAGDSFEFEAEWKTNSDDPVEIEWSVSPAGKATISATEGIKTTLTVNSSAGFGDVITLTAGIKGTVATGDALITVIVKPETVVVTTEPGKDVMARGEKQTLTAVVGPTGAPQKVDWSFEPADYDATISKDGFLEIGGSAALPGTITVRATATGYPNVYGEVKISITQKIDSSIEVDFGDLYDQDPEIIVDENPISMNAQETREIIVKDLEPPPDGPGPIEAYEFLINGNVVQTGPGNVFIFGPQHYGNLEGRFSITVSIRVNGSWYNRIVVVTVIL